jgi:hypothetical protein
MKKFLLISCASVFFMACNNDSKTAIGKNASTIDSVEKIDYLNSRLIINPVIGIWTTRKLWMRYLND